MKKTTEEMRELHEALHRKCVELSARTSAMIDFGAAGEDAEFCVAMIRESLSAVDFWTNEIIGQVQK